MRFIEARGRARSVPVVDRDFCSHRCSGPGETIQILAEQGKPFCPTPSDRVRIEASDEFKSSTITWGKTRNVTADELLAEQENVEDVSTREQIAELLLDLTEHRPIEKRLARENLKEASLYSNDKAVQRAAKAADVVSLRTQTYPPKHYWGRPGQTLDGVDTSEEDDTNVETGVTGLTRENADLQSGLDTEPELSRPGESAVQEGEST